VIEEEDLIKQVADADALNHEQKKQLSEFLKQNQDLCTRKLISPGMIEGVEHSIQIVEGAVPVQEPMRRMSHHDVEKQASNPRICLTWAFHPIQSRLGARQWFWCVRKQDPNVFALIIER